MEYIENIHSQIFTMDIQNITEKERVHFAIDCCVLIYQLDKTL